MKNLVILIFFSFWASFCGVKGKPLPPETPREIGIGKPQYKGVDDELKKSKEKSEKEQ